MKIMGKVLLSYLNMLDRSFYARSELSNKLLQFQTFMIIIYLNILECNRSVNRDMKSPEYNNPLQEKVNIGSYPQMHHFEKHSSRNNF